MSIQVGRPWRNDPRDLSLRTFVCAATDISALTKVRNDTLRPITPPEDFVELDEAAMSKFYSRGDFSLVDNAWLLFHGVEPIGAAVVYSRAIFQDRPPGNFDMYVVPRYASHGLGSRLLAHLEQAALARGHLTLETTVAREDGRSVKFLRGRGFQAVGQSTHMARRDLGTTKTKLPQTEIPGGYAIHSLASMGEPPETYRETANRLGAYDVNYSLIRPDEMMSTMAGGQWDPAGVLFLFDPDNRIVGIIRVSASGSRGYLHEIRLEPGSRGRGLGTLMLATALSYLVECGATHAELDTTGEDTPAHNLAMKAGFSVTRHWLHFLKPLATE